METLYSMRLQLLMSTRVAIATPPYLLEYAASRPSAVLGVPDNPALMLDNAFSDIFF